MSRRTALLFFALGVLTRLPFQTGTLWAHDSVLYERAIARFDPLAQSPQAPGYLYYVLLLRALDALTGDANRAMTIVSLVAGAAAVALLYVLAARLYDERTGRVSALLLLTAVTFWAYGGVAYPYTLLGAASTGCALLLWRAVRSGRPRDLIVASAAWGIAIGVRSDLAVFLAPVWLVAAWSAGAAAAVAGAATIACLVAAWYAASALADGGFARFALALAEQGGFVDERYSVFGASGPRALLTNVYELARYLGRGLYLLVPLVVAVPLSEAARRIELADRRRALFLLLWTLTPLVVYVPIHVGEYGYVFSMLPGLAVIGARGAIALARARMPRVLPLVVGAVVLANAAIFLLSDTPLSATDVMRRDHGTTEKVAYLDAPAFGCAVVVAAYDALIARRYLIDARPGRYDFAPYDPDATGDGELRPARATTVVVWDDLLRVSGPGWTEVRMPHGARLRIARLDESAVLRLHGLAIELVRP